ncbi:MAG: AI-2E family transporter [Pseudomonadota bacterium]
MEAKRSALFWLMLAIAAGWLLYLLKPVLTPFLLGALLAYLCNPLVDWLHAHRVNRTLGAIVVLLLLTGAAFALAALLLPLLQQQTAMLIQHLPGYLESAKMALVPWMRENFGIELKLDMMDLKSAAAQHARSAQDLVARMLPSLKSSGAALVALLANLLLAPLVMIYFLRDWHALLRRIDEMIPRRWHDEILALARDVDGVLGEFLRGQLIVMAVMSTFYVGGLWLTGLDYALPVGLVAGLLVFVPYLGVALGLVLATFTGLMQYGGVSALLPLWGVFLTGHLLESIAVTPYLVGERIGLHPLAVLFSLLAFGQLFGFFGVLLALPASAVLLVGLRHAHGKYLGSDWYRA